MGIGDLVLDGGSNLGRLHPFFGPQALKLENLLLALASTNRNLNFLVGGKLPSGVPVTRNIRTAYAGDQPVEVLDTISNGEAVSYRFEIEV